MTNGEPRILQDKISQPAQTKGPQTVKIGNGNIKKRR